MKYKLINIKTKDETLCDKVTIDGFDYYVSDEAKIESDNLWVVSKRTNYLGKTFYPINDGTVTEDIIKELLLSVKYEGYYQTIVGNGSDCDLTIATNNPNIDIPKVVDEVEIKWLDFNKNYNRYCPLGKEQFLKVVDYNKAKETHTFSEEDMIEFLNFSKSTNKEKSFYEMRCLLKGNPIDSEEILKLWKKQQPKKLYYE